MDEGRPGCCGPPNKVKQRGRLLGVSLSDVVQIDLHRHQLHWERPEVQKGGKIFILEKGYIVVSFTNTKYVMPGQPLYCGPHGELITDPWIYGRAMGRLQTMPDKEGFAKVEIDV